MTMRLNVATQLSKKVQVVVRLEKYLLAVVAPVINMIKLPGLEAHRREGYKCNLK